MDPKQFELLIKPLTKLVKTHASPRGPHKKDLEEYADTCKLVSLPITAPCPDCGKIVEDRRINMYLKVYATGARTTVKRCMANGKSCSGLKEVREIKPRGPYKKRPKRSLDFNDYSAPIIHHRDKKE